MSDDLELRIYLIGEYNVGKKSIIKRFKLVNSSKTFEKKPKKTENENQNELSPEEKEFLHKEKIRQNLMNFTKIYQIGKKKLYLKFYSCLESIPLDVNYEPDYDDKDYDFETNYRITLKPMKNELENFILQKSNFNVDHFFLLIFDLKDFNSFEKLEIIFDNINNHFGIQNYHFALIGNKIDAKMNFSNEEKEKLNNFIKKFNFKYYEISTKMFYNFDGFFFNLLEPVFNDFFESDFKEKINQILHEKKSFAKSDKSIEIINENPAPDLYNPNVFEYPKTKEEFKIAFDKKTKFTNKIFLNKTGPIINEKKRPNTEGNLIDIKNENDPKKMLILAEKNKKIHDAIEIQCKIKGKSIGGISEHNLHLKEQRKNLRNLNSQKFIENFDENLSKLNLILPKNLKINNEKKYEFNKNQIFNKKIENMKKSEQIFKEKQNENVKINENYENEKKIKIMNKVNFYDKKWKNLEKERQNSQEKNRNFPHIKIKSNEEPIAKFYDIRTKFDPKKGFSIQGKWPKQTKKNFDPELKIFLDDFEKILIKNQKRPKINFNSSERFYTPKIEESGDSNFIYEKLKKYEINKINYKLNTKTDFNENRENLKEKVLENKEKIKEIFENKINLAIQKNFEQTGENYLLKQINYSQVEEKSPSYSIKGRNEDKINFFKKLENQKNLLNDLKQNYLIHPNISAIRPKLPVFSFGKSNTGRTQTEPNENNNNNNNKDDYVPFSNGNFTYEDYKSFNTKQDFMGKSEKTSMGIDNGVPGPGYYKIDGFADEIIKKAKMFNHKRISFKDNKNENNNNKNNNNNNDLKTETEENYNDFEKGDLDYLEQNEKDENNS